MSYISLYRKYRSQNFKEIIGQEHIVRTLQNAILNSRLAHAYLFTGPRGTGKTSTARILAKALNCAKGPGAEPCGVCDNCGKITNGHSVDVIEIDAASNRGIDEIRELRERVVYAPVEGRNKIYIIDEVHMLTSEAFNALLKTLEEPPAHTIFVLATTEPNKVPVTISSRCQRLDFRRITLPQVRQHLSEIAKKEGFTLEEKALDLIARAGEGSMRDSISLLDQVVSFAGNDIKADQVVLLLGAADEELLYSLADAIVRNDIAAAMEKVRLAIEAGASSIQVVRDLVNHFRNLLLCKLGAGESLELTADHINRLTLQAEQFSLERVKAVLTALSRAELDMKWHPYGRIVMEVTLVELMGNNVERSGDRLGQVEKSGDMSRRETLVVVEEDKFARIMNVWKEILNKVKEKSLSGFVSLHEGQPREISGSGKLVICFRKGYAFHKQRLDEAKNKETVELAIKEVLGEDIKVESVVDDAEAAPNAVSIETVKEMFGGKVIS